MSLLSHFKAKYPYDRGPYGILMRYLQNFRYFTFIVTILWFFLVLYFKSLDSTFSTVKFVILITIGFFYMITAEITMYLTYSRCPESSETLVKIFGIADILIVTASVLLSGGSQSPFVLMYFFPLANFRIVYGNKGSFAVAGVCLVSYFLALVASSAAQPTQFINFLTVVVPCFLAFTYYLGLILESEHDSRREQAKLEETNKKSKL
ncbi:MAG: hypothetical protein ACYC21_00265 [Eubacteriales bacterium]